ncbi:MAG: right-handed parallel beta-helix repeat-containing protein [Bacteroidaceae bacterium]|nr:right-handed parallel beta-helix repeat-containing protein [Bacteroidaceae bacterium]
MKKRLSILTLMLLVVASISTWALQSKLFATQGDEGTEPQTQGSCLGTLPEEGKMYPQAFIKEFSQEEIKVMLEDMRQEGTLNAGYLFQTFNPNNKTKLPSGKKISDLEISKLFDLLQLGDCESVEALVNKSMELIGNQIDEEDQEDIKSRLTAIYTEMFPYKDYQADFVVSFDEDVDENDYQLWGYYATYNAIAQCPSAKLDANKPYRLLKEGIGGFLDSYIDAFNYFAIAGFVQDFYCGVWGNDNMAGKTITVQLRLFNGKDINSDYYVVSETKYTFPECKIGDKRYATLAQAVTEVNEGETIELLCDVDNADGIIVPSGKNFTVDFAGHTYNVTDNLAGSTGTKNQCFQLLKGSELVFKNGTITTNCAKIGVNSYANLKLVDMTIDMSQTSATGNQIPCLQTCNGNVSLQGNTNLKTRDGQIAVLALYWPNGEYGDINVELNTTGEVKGVMAYGSYEVQDLSTVAQHSHVAIKNGKYDVTFNMDGLQDYDFKILGGIFKTTPDANYLAEGKTVINNLDDTTKSDYPFAVVNAPVAKIGNVEYASLADAVEEVKDGETIELLSDVVLGNETINIGKDNVTLEGHDYTIALDEEDADLQIYGENGTSKSYGSYKMITVSGNNVTLQNMTLDSKDYRGASLATTTGGSNVTYKNITYQGKGSGHYYGNATGGGNLTFEGCTFNTCGYAIHTAETACNLIVKDCVINGWTSYGSAILSASFTNTTFGPSYDIHNNNLCALSIYTNTIFTNCKFEETFTKHGQGDLYYFVGMFTSKPCLIQANGCSMIDKDGKVIKDADLADIADTSKGNWANGAVFAVEPQGNAENGYTAGTFVALDIEDIKPADGYKVKAVEGKDNVYTVSAPPAEEVEIPEEKEENVVSAGGTELQQEQKEQAQQQIQQMAENENIAEVMADKVDEETGEVVKVNNPEEVIENGQSTDAMTVKVAFESAKVEAATESVTIKEVAYDVTPKLVTTDKDGKTTERIIKNEEIKSPIMFALPVDDIPEIGVEQEKHPKYQFAKVYHWREVEDAEPVKEYLGTKPIKFDEKGNYILISSLEFSIFSYELTDEDATLLYVSNEKSSGETVTEQEFFENIQPYHPNALAFVGSEKEQFAKNNTNVVYDTDVNVTSVDEIGDLSGNLICPNLVLTDISTIPASDRETVKTDFYTPKAFTATKLTYTREGTEGLNSVYLPFAFEASDIDIDHASDIKIGVFEKVVEKYADLEYDFAVFNVVESLNPKDQYAACLIKDVRNLPDEDYVWNIKKEGVKILDLSGMAHEPSNTPCLKGSLTTMPLSGNVWKIDDDGQYFGTADNGTCFPFRSYLETSADSGTKLRIAWSDEATGISTIETIDNAKDGIMYNLLGVKVGNDYQGVVIKNGKTMLKK